MRSKAALIEDVEVSVEVFSKVVSRNEAPNVDEKPALLLLDAGVCTKKLPAIGDW
jgi:hypothetical protein